MTRLIALSLVALSLTACDLCEPLWKSITPRGLILPRVCPPKTEFAGLYRSTFPKNPAGCCLIDRFPDRPKHLAKGQAHEGDVEEVDPTSGLVTLVAPSSIKDDPLTNDPMPASVGLFRTGVNFGPGTIFRARATFRRPEGPLDKGAWSVGVTARDGGLDDRFDAKRVSATLRVRRGGAMLNVGAGFDPDDREDAIDIGDLYGAIFNGDQSQPFTLELYVDRTIGRGEVSLIKDGTTRHRLGFKLNDDLKDTLFTTLGATLTDCCVPKAELSAELKEFQIWDHQP